jgi:hypothetical protein
MKRLPDFNSEERSMTPPDFIIALFYAVDQEILDVPKHSEAKQSPIEVVTLALRHAIKAVACAPSIAG